jgi:hypothetical protein
MEQKKYFQKYKKYNSKIFLIGGNLEHEEYSKSIVKKYISFENFFKCKSQMCAPINKLEIYMKLETYARKMTLMNAESFLMNTKYEGFMGCEHNYNSGFKNCYELNFLIKNGAYVFFYNLLEYYVEQNNSVNKLFEGKYEDVEKLRQYLLLFARLIGFTSMEPHYYISSIIKYINEVVGREIVTLDCPANDTSISYTCGRGNVIIYEKEGKNCISISNTVSKEDDYVKYDNYEQLQKGMEMSNNKKFNKTDF